MTSGLEIFDSSGNTTVKITDRLSRVLGAQVITKNVSGSVTNSAFSTGTPFWFVYPTSGSSFSHSPSISIVSNTLSWSWPLTAYTDFNLIYGVF